MTARELYERGPLRVETDLRLLKGSYYDHLPEVTTLNNFDSTEPVQDRVEMRVVAEEWSDHRRFWRVMTVWYRELAELPDAGMDDADLDAAKEYLPVMVCTNGGREGDDHAVRYVTAPRRLQRMAGYIAGVTLRTVGDEDAVNSIVVDAEADVKEMTRFYGWDAFERTGFGYGL